MRYFRSLFLLSLFPIFSGCQKDDICPAGSETTPRLVIEFYDTEDPTTLKAVEDLVIIAEGMEDPYLGPAITNSVEIPLRTTEGTTTYSFISNSGTAEENEDVVTFSYNPAPEYLNRACGYKINFNNLVVSIHPDEDNWLQSAILLEQNIENEAAAHLTFTH